MATKPEIWTIAGREVSISNPDKVFFPEKGYTKRDLVTYYLALADGALRGAGGRPMALKRFVNGAGNPGDFFFQKRAPESRPPWIEVVELSFPSGRTAHEIVLRDAAQLAWIVNLGCVDLNPHPVRADDLDHPDELRVDLDPMPGVTWDHVRKVALVARKSLESVGLVGWPKTSGSRGIHINVRIERKWTFPEVRRAALALARDVERRAPDLATSKWWKEERHGVFLDYNQNAKDRTTCSAYSVRPLPDARVSTPLWWDEVAACDPADFTVLTVPARFASRGDPHADMNESVGSLERLLDLAARDDAEGLGDAPWPPHFAKGEGEAPRVAPSRAKGVRAAKGVSGAKPGDDAGAEEGGKPAAKRAAARAPRTKMPLLVVANSPDKDAALAGLARWKAKHPPAAALLAVDDVLVDSMRGRSTTWTRIRVNLRAVPEAERPPQETPDPDDDPTRAWTEARRAAKSAPKAEPTADPEPEAEP